MTLVWVLHHRPGQSHPCLLTGSLQQPLSFDLDFFTVFSAQKSGVIQLKQKSCHVSSNLTFYWLFMDLNNFLTPPCAFFTLLQLWWPPCCSFSASWYAFKPQVFAHFTPHAYDTLLSLFSELHLSSYLQVPAQALREVFLNHSVCTSHFLIFSVSLAA